MYVSVKFTDVYSSPLYRKFCQALNKKIISKWWGSHGPNWQFLNSWVFKSFCFEPEHPCRCYPVTILTLLLSTVISTDSLLFSATVDHQHRDWHGSQNSWHKLDGSASGNNFHCMGDLGALNPIRRMALEQGSCVKQEEVLESRLILCLQCAVMISFMVW